MQRLFVESILAPKLNTVMYHFIYYHGERSLVKCNQTLFFQRTPSAIFVRSTSNLKQSDYWGKKSWGSESFFIPRLFQVEFLLVLFIDI